MRAVLTILALFLVAQSAASQALQAGDTISISVYQDSKLDRQVVIGPSGTFSFPLVGRVQAQGLTAEELEKLLKKKLASKYTMAPDVTISVLSTNLSKEENKPKFFVTGQVARPGPYEFAAGTSVMQAIAMSGGLGPYAARSRIQVHRKIAGVDSTLKFDYAAFESGDDVSGNIELQPGDIVIVPQKGFFE